MPQVADLGFTVLYEPKVRPVAADIFLIHGLQGHPKKTWTHKSATGLGHIVPEKFRATQSTEVYWPQDLLPEDCPAARILTFGYNSLITTAFWGTVNQNTLFAHARDLLYGLARERTQAVGRPIVFVAHSLGGIIIKDVLRRASRPDAEAQLLDIYKSTYGIIFLGTPHRGSAIASWGSIARNLAAVIGKDTNGKNLKDLSLDSGVLEILKEEFALLLSRKLIRIRTFQEGRGISGVPPLHMKARVVSPESSTLNDIDQRETIDANHMEMCRFSGRDDDGYKKVKGELEIMVHQILAMQRQEEETKDLVVGNIASSEINQALLKDHHAQGIELNTWLSPISTLEDLEEIREKRQPETCKWLESKQGYRDWRDPSNERYNLLWVDGKPGCGKTFLCAKLVDGLISGNAPVAYFFVKAEDFTKRSALSVVRTWCWQLLKQLPSEHDKVFNIYQKTAGLTLTLPAAKEVLFHLIRRRKTTHLVLDGLDECSTAKDISDLIDICTEATKSSKVLITGRNESTIRQAVASRFEGRSARYSIESKDVDADITAWLKKQVKLLELGNPMLEEDVAQRLVAGSDGMFLWVRLQLENLALVVSPDDIPRALGSLPPGLPATYESMLGRIKGQTDQRRVLACDILQWVTSVYRPLSIQELAAALKIRIDGRVSDGTGFLNPWKLFSDICCGMVEIVKSGHVRLIHASVQEFLTDKGSQIGLLGQESHESQDLGNRAAHVPQACMTYLSYEDIDMVRADSYQMSKKIKEHLRLYPFLEYAASNWWRHLGDHSNSDRPELQVSVRRFTMCQKNVVKWLQVHQHLQVEAGKPSFLFKPTAGKLWPFLKNLWMSHLGRSDSGLVDRWNRWEIENWFTLSLWNSMAIAAFFDFQEVVQEEIDLGISVDSQDSNGFGPIHQAAHGDSLHVVELLTKYNANVDLETFLGYSPVRYAARNGLSTLSLLLNNSARIDLRDKGTRRTALHEASASVFWHPMMIEKLLQSKNLTHDIVNQRDVDGQTALHYASAIDIVFSYTTLKACESGAKSFIPAPQWELYTPRSEETMRTLKDKWRVLNFGSSESKEESLRTIMNLKSHIMEVLLKSGADVNAQNDAGETPIHVALANAIERDSPELRQYLAIPLQILISAPGSRLELRDKKQRTPLMLAIGGSSLFFTRMLLEAGAGHEDFDGPDLENLRALLNKETTQRLSQEIGHSAVSVRSPLHAFQRIHDSRSTGPSIRNCSRAENTESEEDWLYEHYVAHPSKDGFAVFTSEPLSGCKHPLRRIEFTFKPSSKVGRMDAYLIPVPHSRFQGMLRIVQIGTRREDSKTIEAGPHILEEQPEDIDSGDGGATRVAWSLSGADSDKTSDRAKSWMRDLAAGDRIMILYHNDIEFSWFAHISVDVYTSWV